MVFVNTLGGLTDLTRFLWEFTGYLPSPKFQRVLFLELSITLIDERHVISCIPPLLTAFRITGSAKVVLDSSLILSILQKIRLRSAMGALHMAWG